MACGPAQAFGTAVAAATFRPVARVAAAIATRVHRVKLMLSPWYFKVGRSG
jgi:hypothetical protein